MDFFSGPSTSSSGGPSTSGGSSSSWINTKSFYGSSGQADKERMKEERKKKLRQIEENKKGPGKPSKPQKAGLHFRKFWSSDFKPFSFHFWSLFLPGPNQRTCDDERDQHIRSTRHILLYRWKNPKAQGKKC